MTVFEMNQFALRLLGALERENVSFCGSFGEVLLDTSFALAIAC